MENWIAKDHLIVEPYFNAKRELIKSGDWPSIIIMTLSLSTQQYKYKNLLFHSFEILAVEGECENI